MPFMTLGAYTFERNPSIYAQPDLMTPIRNVAAVDTYSSVKVFSWGVSVIGKEITLKWNYLPDSQYQSLLTLLLADVAVVFDPNAGDDKTYNVEIMGLTGKIHYKLKATRETEDVWRKNIEVKLLVLSEVA